MATRPEPRRTVWPDDPRTLLPHFTVALWSELERRLTQRVLEDMANPDTPTNLFGYLPPAYWARELVSRIYRTQLKETFLALDIANATLAYGRRLDAERALLASLKAPQKALA
jgi:hypothetical protein